MEYEGKRSAAGKLLNFSHPIFIADQNDWNWMEQEPYNSILSNDRRGNICYWKSDCIDVLRCISIQGMCPPKTEYKGQMCHNQHKNWVISKSPSNVAKKFSFQFPLFGGFIWWMHLHQQLVKMEQDISILFYLFMWQSIYVQQQHQPCSAESNYTTTFSKVIFTKFNLRLFVYCIIAD